MRRPALALAFGAALAAAPAACESEPRIVRYKPFFAGLEGVQTETPAVGAEPGIADPTVAPGGQIVIENPDGSVRLVARSALHLMAHIQRTLDEGDEALFTEQVLSEQTAAEFRVRGYEPEEAFRFLSREENRREIARLFARMPMGERSPAVIAGPIGPKTWRVKVTGRAAAGLRWVGFDMVREDGEWRLRWLF